MSAMLLQRVAAGCRVRYELSRFYDVSFRRCRFIYAA